MVWITPTKTTGGKVFWNKIRSNPFFILQKHKTQGGSDFISSTFVSLRSLRIENAGLFRIIFAEFPHHTIAESETEDEIEKHWEFLDKEFIPKLLTISTWYDYALFFFSENSAHKRTSVESIYQTQNSFNNDSHKDIYKSDTSEQETAKGVGECVVCYENEANTVLINCGHICLCEKCTKNFSFTSCPVCRKNIPKDGIMKVFKC